MARKESNNLNIVHREGPPPDRMASPITTGFSPAQRGTLDTVRNLPAPTDSLGFCGPTSRTKTRK